MLASFPNLCHDMDRHPDKPSKLCGVGWLMSGPGGLIPGLFFCPPILSAMSPLLPLRSHGEGEERLPGDPHLWRPSGGNTRASFVYEQNLLPMGPSQPAGSSAVAPEMIIYYRFINTNQSQNLP